MTRIPIVDKRSASGTETEAASPAPRPLEEAGARTGEPDLRRAAEEPWAGRLAAVEVERDEWRERALRLGAELENLRKLVEQRVANEVFRREQERLVRWLELGDALERALRQAATAAPEWRRGLEELVRAFEELLARAGATRVDTSGPFDPAVHEALAVTADPGRPDGTIAAVERSGWKHGERLLRAAAVVVVRNGTT